MNYFVVEVCCLDCLKFINAYFVNCDNLLELKKYLKELSIDNNNSFIVYDEYCKYEIIRYSFYN